MSRKIPFIHFNNLASASELKLLDSACREWGFFYLKDHGIEFSLLQDLESEMRQFFQLSPGEKKNIERTRKNPWGYYDKELTKQTRDWKELLDIGLGKSAGPFINHRTQWSAHNNSFKPVAETAYRCFEEVAFALLDACASNLGVPEQELRKAFTPEHTSYLRLNHYPPCAKPALPDDLSLPESGNLGINFHSDAGVMTVLYISDQPGLEVFKNSKWSPVNHVPDCLVINLGDMMQVWSNDRYPAPIHRVVVNADAERFSAPFFFNPSYQADIAPLVDTSENPGYQSINWGNYRFRRAEGDYDSYGEEVQIDQYRISQP
jgi:isopenicillin N synthase-like dioxygenase